MAEHDSLEQPSLLRDVPSYVTYGVGERPILGAGMDELTESWESAEHRAEIGRLNLDLSVECDRCAKLRATNATLLTRAEAAERRAGELEAQLKDARCTT